MTLYMPDGLSLHRPQELFECVDVDRSLRLVKFNERFFPGFTDNQSEPHPNDLRLQTNGVIERDHNFHNLSK